MREKGKVPRHGWIDRSARPDLNLNLNELETRKEKMLFLDSSADILFVEDPSKQRIQYQTVFLTLYKRCASLLSQQSQLLGDGCDGCERN